jgi:hypothetical protein
MAEEKRDLEFYLANPEQMPGDMSQLVGLMGDQNLDAGEGDAGQMGEEGAASGAAGKGEAAKTGEAEAAPATTGKEGESAPAVLLSKDGKHQIPYSVLQSEREARRAAESVVEQMRQRLDALEQQAKGGQAAPADAAPESVLSEEDVAQIESDFPAIGKLLKGMAAKVGELTERLESVRQSEINRRQGEANRASTTVQEAIDNSGPLSYWQQKDPEMFQVATNFDNQIKADPRNRGLTLDQRFERVVKAVEAVYGETQLPEEFRRNAPAPAAAPAPAPAAPAVDPKAVAAAAQKAIETAQASSTVKSLSDIPGGVPPESDEITQLGLMSAADLGNKFMNMDPAKVMAILAKAA